VFNKLFGRKRKSSRSSEEEKELTIDDLITLERYDEAETALKAHFKLAPKDLHSHLRLAEVYVALRNVEKAILEYMFVADSHAEDGFFDKAIAVAARAAKINPGDDNLPRRIEKYRAMKRLEKRRQYAIDGLLSNKTTGIQTAGNSKLQMEFLWNKIAKSHIVAQLDGDNIQKLFAVMDMMETKEGQILADQKSSVPAIYLVVSGVIEALALVNGKPTNIRSFTTGDLIGDSALLEHKPWPAEYKVTQPGTLFRLDREGLETVMAGNTDPVAFLSVLRQQHLDRDVAVSIQRLQAS
jgi:tetratricopeptide (TPR) repeat protein